MRPLPFPLSWSKEKAKPNGPDPGRSLKAPTLEAALTRFHHAAIRHEPAASGVYADLPAEVNPILRRALEARGISRLYSHQAEAFQSIAKDENVVVVTPTASGKTLCYNLPVLNALLADPGARAMYLFPTKALAEDQLHELADRHRPHGVGICAPSPTMAIRRRTPARPSASAPTSC